MLLGISGRSKISCCRCIERNRCFSQNSLLFRGPPKPERKRIHDSVIEPDESLFQTLVMRRIEFLQSSSKCATRALTYGISNLQFPSLAEQFGKEIFLPGLATQPFLPSFPELKKAHKSLSVPGLDTALFNGFLSFALHNSTASAELQIQRNISDMRYPHEWFPAARTMQRTWHLHIGPTNSGKTYHALCRLEASESGVYAGPLRLLAHEIYEQLNSKGVACNLLTGEERRVISPNAKITSSTIEMIELSRTFDVAVIDEIQMIGDSERGWAWTAALLGVQAKEIHLCGEESVVDILEKLANQLGDQIIIHRYKRLGPLVALPQSLNGQLSAVRKGDCVVTFSRRNIFSIKRSIEELTGLRCALAYGGLPPETRTAQARLFNDPESGYDVLVASDAVGMGLNLYCTQCHWLTTSSIRRIVFETMAKYNGACFETIPTPQIKQIAGRAGRYRVPDPTMGQNSELPNTGYVTTLDPEDLGTLLNALSHPTVPLTSLGLCPTNDIVEQFASSFPPTTPFSLILKHLQAMSYTVPTFHLCSIDEKIHVAHMIDSIQGLSVADRYTICCSPVNLRDHSVPANLVAFAKAISKGQTLSIAEMKGIDLEAIDFGPPQNIRNLERLESLHRVLLVYFWLAQRFPATFKCNEQAEEIKQTVENLIARGLTRMRFVVQKGARSFKGSRFEMDNMQRTQSSTPLRTVQSLSSNFSKMPHSQGSLNFRQ